MISLPLLGLLLFGSAQARVTFTHSEVLQESDLVPGNRAAFKCENGCSVYTDSRASSLFIIEFDEATLLDKRKTSFSEMGGDFLQLLQPFKLEASKNYFISNMENVTHKFVFYAVDNDAPNADADVMVVTSDQGIWRRSVNRTLTLLNSRFDSVRYSQFGVPTVSAGYPRIYATGFDAVEEVECLPLFQARSLQDVMSAGISVFSPISTVDYNSETNHEVSVNWNEEGVITSSARSSTVYHSPGYVGCSYNDDQSYASSKTSLQDSFTLIAPSLDVIATFNLPTAEDAPVLTINNDNIEFFGIKNPVMAHYNADSYNVSISWTRKSSLASFAMQLDFGLGKTEEPSTKPTAAPEQITTEAVTIISTEEPTTTSASGLTICASMMAVMFALW